jgi:DNA-binding MarR family transcriptional regulator
MSLTALSTLASLDHAGPRRVGDLAALEGITQPSMTALVNALERSGLVRRQDDPADKRAALVVLTETGKEFVKERRQAGAEAFAQLIAKLPSEQAATLRAALPALERLYELDEEQRSPGSI